MTALRVLGLDFEVGGRRCGDRHFEIAEWQQLNDETELLRQSALRPFDLNGEAKISPWADWPAGFLKSFAK